MSENVSVELESLFPLIKQKLASGGDITFGPKGVSMLPLIRQGIDSVKISPVNDVLKKYDVPLYRRADGQFVLHRIVDVQNNTYTMCGDNQCVLEKGVTHDMIIGVMTEIIKPEGVIRTTDKSYISYCKKQVRKQFIKRQLHPIKVVVKIVLKKMHLYK